MDATARFLVQHCLKGDGRAPAVHEIATTSFEHVENTVLTNNGQYSPLEVTGLVLEAFQPDFDDWIVPSTVDDLMTSRKLRVVTPAPQFEPPEMPIAQHQEQLLPPLLLSSDAMIHDAPPLPPLASPPAARASVTIEMKDVLLAVASLPRTTEPSCSSVLEHLARQRLPSLGAMVEDALRECGHQAVWEQAPRPSPTAPIIASIPQVADDQRDDALLGTLTRWERGAGFVQPDGTHDRALSAYAHISDNPLLVSASAGDRVRYKLAPNPKREGKMMVVAADVIRNDTFATAGQQMAASSSSKRNRGDQQGHPADSEHELEQRRKRSDDSREGMKTGILIRWERSSRGSHGDVQQEGGRKETTFLHINENPCLQFAKAGDSVRYKLTPHPRRRGKMIAVGAVVAEYCDYCKNDAHDTIYCTELGKLLMQDDVPSHAIPALQEVHKKVVEMRDTGRTSFEFRPKSMDDVWGVLNAKLMNMKWS